MINIKSYRCPKIVKLILLGSTNYCLFVSVVGSYISMLMGELLNHLKVINIVRLIIVGIFVINW